MVIRLLVIWSIGLSSSLVHLKKGPEYLTRGSSPGFIPLIMFLLDSFVSKSFFVLLRYSFVIFYLFHLHLFESVSLQGAQIFVGFLFSEGSNIVFIWSIHSSVRCRLALFITSMAHFSLSNSIPMLWLYILTACIRVFRSFSVFANSLMSHMYIKW